MSIVISKLRVFRREQLVAPDRAREIGTVRGLIAVKHPDGDE